MKKRHRHLRDIKKRKYIRSGGWEDHIDKEWISSKIDGHGGSYGFTTTTGPVQIDYIGSTSKWKVFGYNITLYLRWIKRSLKARFKRKIKSPYERW